jgi:ribosomal protein S21
MRFNKDLQKQNIFNALKKQTQSNPKSATRRAYETENQRSQPKNPDSTKKQG